MDLSRLRALRELSLRRTMAAVAEALHISPSAVSQQISQLEEETGLSLVERRGRGVKLTPAGDMLVAHAESILTVLQNARTDLAELKRDVAGDLRLAAFSSAAAVLGAVSIKSLEKTHTRLRITLEEIEPNDALTALRAWESDVALIDDLTVLSEQIKENIEIAPIARDMLYVTLPAEHRLARRTTIHITDLRSERWALDTASSTYTDVIVRMCRAAGFEPEINGMCSSFEALIAMIEAGCSISILPGMRIRRTRQEDRKIVFRKLIPETQRKIFVAYRRGELRSPKISALVEVLKASAAMWNDGV